MPRDTSSRLLEEQFPELRLVCGVLVAYERGGHAEWLEHAWNTTADGNVVDATVRQQPGVRWRYIPVSTQYEAELAKVRHEFDFHEDPVSLDNDDANANQEAQRKAQAQMNSYRGNSE